MSGGAELTGRESAARDIEALRDQLVMSDDSEGAYLTAAVLTRAAEVARGGVT